MSLFEISILIVLVYICAFTLVDRICKCIEYGYVAKCYGKLSNKEINTLKDECDKKLGL